jgi:hypothetical protein
VSEVGTREMREAIRRLNEKIRNQIFDNPHPLYMGTDEDGAREAGYSEGYAKAIADVLELVQPFLNDASDDVATHTDWVIGKLQELAAKEGE